MNYARFAALTVFACVCAPTHANLLDDGSFDLSTSDTQTSNSAWVLDVNLPDDTNPAAQFWQNTAGSNDAADPHKGVWFRSFEGTQGDGDAFAYATLSQQLIGVPAGDYTLRFDAKREVYFTAGSWSVTLDSNESGSSSIDLLVAAPNDGLWHNYEVALFGVTAGSTLVVSAQMVNGEQAIGVNPQSAFVDNFVLVPEPASLVLVGLGLFGLIGFTRRKPLSPLPSPNP